jgi:hypothetical protein
MPQLNVAPGPAEVGGASAPESAGWPLQGKRVWGWASVLAGIAALALTLRLWNAASFPIFLDEASYSRWAHDIWAARTRSALLLPVRDDGKTPLFFIIQALGFALTGDVLQAGRVLSAASGTVTVVLTGLLGARLYSPHLGLAAAACYALLPAADGPELRPSTGCGHAGNGTDPIPCRSIRNERTAGRGHHVWPGCSQH